LIPARVNRLLRRRLTANDVGYDLGSGDGRNVVVAAQQYGAGGVASSVIQTGPGSCHVSFDLGEWTPDLSVHGRWHLLVSLDDPDSLSAGVHFSSLVRLFSRRLLIADLKGWGRPEGYDGCERDDARAWHERAA